jgi:hypothetical protein
MIIGDHSLTLRPPYSGEGTFGGCGGAEQAVGRASCGGGVLRVTNLKASGSEPSTHELPRGGSPVTIGRAKSNSVALHTDLAVSALHAELVEDPWGVGYFVRDLGSSNGTTIRLSAGAQSPCVTPWCTHHAPSGSPQNGYPRAPSPSRTVTALRSARRSAAPSSQSRASATPLPSGRGGGLRWRTHTTKTTRCRRPQDWKTRGAGTSRSRYT